LNLNELFELQAKLDAHIEKEHPRQPGEDRLAKKILALKVELGECAQEWRGFKYWSKDQEPRIKDYKQTKCKWCNGSGDDGTGVCPDCRSSGDVYKEYNPLLEEYVDCLHFILSIGLELGMDEIADELDLKKFDFLTSNTILSCFIGLSYDIADLYYQRENDDMVPYLYEHILLEFAKLGKMLGFTWEQIETAYYEKNKINHQRQEENY